MKRTGVLERATANGKRAPIHRKSARHGRDRASRQSQVARTASAAASCSVALRRAAHHPSLLRSRRRVRAPRNSLWISSKRHYNCVRLTLDTTRSKHRPTDSPAGDVTIVTATDRAPLTANCKQCLEQTEIRSDAQFSGHGVIGRGRIPVITGRVQARDDYLRRRCTDRRRCRDSVMSNDR